MRLLLQESSLQKIENCGLYEQGGERGNRRAVQQQRSERPGPVKSATHKYREREREQDHNGVMVMQAGELGLGDPGSAARRQGLEAPGGAERGRGGGLRRRARAASPGRAPRPP